jgi:hypothetical protein
LSDHAVGLFAAGTDREVARLPTESLLTHVCFSPDNTQLLITYEPGFAELWNLRLIRQELAEMGLDWDHPPYDSQRRLDITSTEQK